jgi:hypothetical protein
MTGGKAERETGDKHEYAPELLRARAHSEPPIMIMDPERCGGREERQR